MCCAHTFTHTCRHKPCVRCRAKPCMSFLFVSSSPATLLQPECWLDIDQPHESPSNEQYEPKGRASGKEADYHHTSKRQRPQLLKSPSPTPDSSSFRQELYFERNHPSTNYTEDVFLQAKVARACVCVFFCHSPHFALHVYCDTFQIRALRLLPDLLGYVFFSFTFKVNMLSNNSKT